MYINTYIAYIRMYIYLLYTYNLIPTVIYSVLREKVLYFQLYPMRVFKIYRPFNLIAQQQIELKCTRTIGITNLNINVQHLV